MARRWRGNARPSSTLTALTAAAGLGGGAPNLWNETRAPSSGSPSAFQECGQSQTGGRRLGCFRTFKVLHRKHAGCAGSTGAEAGAAASSGEGWTDSMAAEDKARESPNQVTPPDSPRGEPGTRTRRGVCLQRLQAACGPLEDACSLRLPCPTSPAADHTTPNRAPRSSVTIQSRDNVFSRM